MGAVLRDIYMSQFCQVKNTYNTKETMRRKQQWQYLTGLSRQRFDEQSSKLFDTGLTKYDEQ